MWSAPSCLACVGTSSSSSGQLSRYSSGWQRLWYNCLKLTLSLASGCLGGDIYTNQCVCDCSAAVSIFHTENSDVAMKLVSPPASHCVPTNQIPLPNCSSYIHSPAAHHHCIDGPCTPRRWRVAHLAADVVNNLLVREVLERFSPNRPYLIEHHPKTPYITGSGEPSVEQSFRCHPFDRERPVLCGLVVLLVSQISCHPKIPNLHTHTHREQ